jgi:bacteriocin-like protein
MTQSQNTGFRVLARDVAQELNADELAQVSGGEDSVTGRVTFSANGGTDFETCTSNNTK